MRTPLLFRASSNGRMFGLLSVRNGVATAHVAEGELTRVLLGHAMCWIERHNPDPDSHVTFELIRELDDRADGGQPVRG